MKRILASAAAALLSASVLVAPVYAQTGQTDSPESAGSDAGAAPDAGLGTTSPEQAGENAGAGASVGGDATTGVDGNTTAAIGNDMNSALSAIEGNSASAQAIMGMEDVSSVNVVRLSEIDGYDQAAIDDALGANGATDLQASIESNAALQQHLQQAGVDASSVVAAQVEADGALTVYVR